MAVADNPAPDTTAVGLSGQSGRVRLDDDEAVALPQEETSSGWSALGVVIAIVVIALMVAILVLLLWAVYRTTPT